MAISATRLRTINASDVRNLLEAPYAFGECIDLRNHSIHGSLRINNLNIGGVDFSGCVFTESVDFRGSVLEGLSWFKHTRFCSTISFAGTRFSNDARFDNSCFQKDADFSSVTFWGVGCFDGVEAQQQLLMNNITAYGNMSMAASRFEQKVNMTNAVLMGGLWMPRSNPDALQGMNSCEVHGRVETSDKTDF